MHKFIQLVANSYSTDGKPESLAISDFHDNKFMISKSTNF
jgi:hypothetical protein